MAGYSAPSADPSVMLPGVYATYNAVDPATVVPSTSSYSSAGANSGGVGRSEHSTTWAPMPIGKEKLLPSP